MSVFAGYGGQKFIEESYGRVEAMKSEIIRQGSTCEIEVDGGISPSNSKRLADAGAEILVAGSSIFKAEKPEAAIEAMR
jgi:ribulose-phosphate 3-epimerase